jgi:hypothetical protein
MPRALRSVAIAQLDVRAQRLGPLGRLLDCRADAACLAAAALGCVLVRDPTRGPGIGQFAVIQAMVDTTPVATLVYGRRMHLISPSAVPSTRSSQDVSVRKSIRGYNVTNWSEDGVDYRPQRW